MNNIDGNNIPTDAHITIDETGMPTDAYITVKCNEKGEVDIYVGGKPATKYRGQYIWNIPFIKEQFAWMQNKNPDIEEFHVGAFATRGKFKAHSDIHSSGFGPNLWCRLKFKNGETSSWVFLYTYGSADVCANDCALYCAGYVRNFSGFRTAVFNAPIDKSVKLGRKGTLVQALKNRISHVFVGKTFEIKGYTITIEKIAQNSNQR